MSGVMDDLDARVGSTTSLLRTVIGTSVRTEGGWLSSSAFVTLLEELGVPAGRTRTALTRLKAKGIVVLETRAGSAGYSLTDAARLMLERGDRRIYQPRFMDDDQDWFVISFTVPEDDRQLRHQLKRRLSWIGCGSVAGALWIGPGFLIDEAEQIVADLGLTGQVTFFVVQEIRGATAPADAIARWWDLPAIAARHEDFLAAHGASLAAYRADPGPQNAFRRWVLALDAWRPIPYVDPGLPLSLLPDDWPGRRSIPAFLELRDALSVPAAEYIHTVVASPVVARTAHHRGQESA
ncbi:PaaX family transcriptional regulator [Nocardioides daeguensis]|uniref:PaaX family transcriptional regulator C-terminal domain-containing protein n=1 Tax=Nocardioides daeguensis TaxID=908359 RepID=A0ABP6UZJ2_9ACTN|nr:PaaX family transcriptional regulator C-terminal domain-containing protein [Nocardioides daeguensis]MBV6727181.1 hypothetical protein [Nocardioides daeguensis]MCR1771195.1 hypothetical protein [Nocardioides daeguensis]